jgi:hypothetical protein
MRLPANKAEPMGKLKISLKEWEWWTILRTAGFMIMGISSIMILCGVKNFLPGGLVGSGLALFSNGWNPRVSWRPRVIFRVLGVVSVGCGVYFGVYALFDPAMLYR